MINTLKLPDGLTINQFLSEYWQKKPLLIRGAIPDYRCPLSPEELAGLSCEEEIESRIVLERDGSKPWEARVGPFSEADYKQLPKSHWTLLVQDVDKHVTEVTKLLDYFTFLPSWRLDDIMISYAADQGSVGPHIDDYDVFLFQTAGKRRWKIHTYPVSENDYIEGLDLRILPEFEAEYEWVLEPGDVLYLPPNVAHWGLAEGDGCMTCSVGFRTPTFQEMAAAWCDEILQSQIPEGRYRDGPLAQQSAPGEIVPTALNRVSNLLNEMLTSTPEQQSRWFGRFITEPKAHLQLFPTDNPINTVEFLLLLQSNESLHRNGWTRIAFCEGSDQHHLFVNGDEFSVPTEQLELLKLLTEQRQLDSVKLLSWSEHPAALGLLTKLYNEGHLLVDHD